MKNFNKCFLIIMLSVPNIGIFAENYTNILINDTKCLELSNANIGTKLRAENCNQDADKQQFMLQNGLVKTKLDPTKCLSIVKGNDQLNSNVFVWSCSTDSEKQDYIQQVDVVSNSLRLPSSNLCFAMNNSNEVIVETCNKTITQSISFIVEIKIKDKCAELNGTDLGVILKSNSCNNSSAQKFFVTSENIKPLGDVTKCLDSFNDTKDNKSVYLNQCIPGNNDQKFIIGTDALIKSFNGKCFAIFNGSKYGVNDPIELDQC